jgi:hypothetical protein
MRDALYRDGHDAVSSIALRSRHGERAVADVHDRDERLYIE